MFPSFSFQVVSIYLVVFLGLFLLKMHILFLSYLFNADRKDTIENTPSENTENSSPMEEMSSSDADAENFEMPKDNFEENSDSPVGHLFPNGQQPSVEELSAMASNDAPHSSSSSENVQGTSRSSVEKAHHSKKHSHLKKLHKNTEKKQDISTRCMSCGDSCHSDCFDNHHFGGGYGHFGGGFDGGYGGGFGQGDFGYGGNYGGYGGNYGGYGGNYGGYGGFTGHGSFEGYGHGGAYGHNGYIAPLGGFDHHDDHHQTVVKRPDLVVPQPPDVVHRPDIVIHRKPIIIHRRPVIYHQNPIVVHKPPVVVHQSPIYVHPVVHHHRIITHHVHDYHIEPQVQHSGCECQGKRDCLCDPDNSSGNTKYSNEEKKDQIEGKFNTTNAVKKQDIAARCLDCGDHCDSDCPGVLGAGSVGGLSGSLSAGFDEGGFQGNTEGGCIDQVPLVSCERRTDERVFKRPDIVVPQPPDIIHRPDIVIHRAPIVIHRRPVVYHQSPIVVHKPPVIVHQAPIIVHPVVHHHRVITHHVHDFHLMPHHQSECGCTGKKDCICENEKNELNEIKSSENGETGETTEPAESETNASEATEKVDVNSRSKIPRPSKYKRTVIAKNNNSTQEDYSTTKKKKKDVVVSRPPIIYHPPPEIYHRPDIVVHRPPLLIHRPSIIYHQPPVIVHRPAVVYHQPPLVFHQPPPAVQQPLLVSHDSFRLHPSAVYTHMGSVVNKVGSYVGIPHGPISNYPHSRFYGERGYGPPPLNGYRDFGNDRVSYVGPHSAEGHALFNDHALGGLGFGEGQGFDERPMDFGHGESFEHIESFGHSAENFAPSEGFEHAPAGFGHGGLEGFGQERFRGFRHSMRPEFGHQQILSPQGLVAQRELEPTMPESRPSQMPDAIGTRREMLPVEYERGPAGGMGFPSQGNFR